MTDQEEDRSRLITGGTSGYTLVSQTEEDIPPAYEATSSTSSQNAPNNNETVEQKDSVTVKVPYPEKLPTYEDATTLPTYEDYQESKQDEARQEVIEMIFGRLNDDEVYVDGIAVGTDCMFLFSFILAFFFNWIGFFIGYCILMNLAGRYGAMTGLGLSLVNWLFYVKYARDEETIVGQERVLIWWLFLCIAVLISLKGLVNWCKARKLLEMTPEQRQNGRVVVLY